MAGQSASNSGALISNTVQRSMLSVLRFSGAVALYGVESFQTAVSLNRDGGLSKAMSEMSLVLDSMSDSVEQHMQEGNRAIADSAGKFTKTVVQQSITGFGFVDPRRMARLAGKFMESSARAVSGGGRTKGSSQDPEVQDEMPRLAVDILDAPQH